MPERTVHLHVGRSVHPVYLEQLHALPAGFRYRFVHPGLADPTTPTVRIVSQDRRFRTARTLVKRGATRVLIRWMRPGSHARRTRNAQLIRCARNA